MYEYLSIRLRAIPLLAAAILVVVGCHMASSPSDQLFPAPGDTPGWKPTGEPESYDSENLYDLVDGQAESFLAYGFEEALVRRYAGPGGAMVRIVVWRLTSSSDAYGLFSASIAGAPIDVGIDGDWDQGQRIAFWQDRYYVQILARPDIPDAELRGFGDVLSRALPSGGERPDLLQRLPRDGLVERSALFFHQEISMDSVLWLGGGNPLRLSPTTDGVLARYRLGDATVSLMLVQYESDDNATDALAALEDTQIEELVVADVRGDTLAAVFGEVDVDAAESLLAEVHQ